jgi:hypothetical protein
MTPEQKRIAELSACVKELEFYMWGDKRTKREGLVAQHDRMQKRYNRLVAWLSGSAMTILLLSAAVAFFGGRAIIQFLAFAGTLKDVIP